MTNLITFSMLSCGAIMGASLRHVFNHFSSGIYSVVIVNSLGCYLAGLFLSNKIPYLNISIANHKVLFLTGFCGALTTFSAFSIETIDLLQKGLFLKAFSYIILSLLLSFTCLYIGMRQ